MRYALSYQTLFEPEDPYRDFEPTGEEVAARAAYLHPLLAKSRRDAGELLATVTGTPGWEEFALTLHDGDGYEAIRLAARLMSKAVNEEATRLAEAELWRTLANCSDTALLNRIGATDVWTWLRERDA